MDKARLIEPLVRPGRCDSEVGGLEADRVRNILRTTGEEKVIVNYIPDKLEATGWNDLMFKECCEWLKRNTASGKKVYYGQKIRESFREPEDVDPGELVEPLIKLGMSLMPDKVCTEISEHIFKVIKEHMTT